MNPIHSLIASATGVYLHNQIANSIEERTQKSWLQSSLQINHTVWITAVPLRAAGYFSPTYSLVAKSIFFVSLGSFCFSEREITPIEQKILTCTNHLNYLVTIVSSIALFYLNSPYFAAANLTFFLLNSVSTNDKAYALAKRAYEISSNAVKKVYKVSFVACSALAFTEYVYSISQMNLPWLKVALTLALIYNTGLMLRSRSEDDEDSFSIVSDPDHPDSPGRDLHSFSDDFETAKKPLSVHSLNGSESSDKVPGATTNPTSPCGSEFVVLSEGKKSSSLKSNNPWWFLSW